MAMANSSQSNLIKTRDLLLKDHGSITICVFTGEDRNQTENFLSKIDDLITVYGQSDAQANRLAIMVIESIPDSPAALWLKAAKLEESIAGDNATHKNLNTWDLAPENGVERPGLRKALEKVYGATTDNTAIFRKLTEGKEQKSLESFHSYFMRRQTAHMEYVAAITTNWKNKTQEQKWTTWSPHQAAVSWEVETYCRPKVRKYIQEIRLSKTIADMEALLKQVALWELTDEGNADLKQTKSAVAAVSQQPRQNQQSQQQQQKRKQQSSSKEGPPQCSYCGLYGHEKKICKFRIRDESNGIKREKHVPFPIKSRRQQQREAERRKENNSAGPRHVSAVNDQQSNSQSQTVPSNSGSNLPPQQIPNPPQAVGSIRAWPQHVGQTGTMQAFPALQHQQLGNFPIARYLPPSQQVGQQSLQLSSVNNNNEQPRGDHFLDDASSIHG